MERCLPADYRSSFTKPYRLGTTFHGARQQAHNRLTEAGYTLSLMLDGEEPAEEGERALEQIENAVYTTPQSRWTIEEAPNGAELEVRRLVTIALSRAAAYEISETDGKRIEPLDQEELRKLLVEELDLRSAADVERLSYIAVSAAHKFLRYIPH